MIYQQGVCEWWRGRGRVSPGGLLASCSALPSPASSPGGPLPSDVSSLAPTSPPSPPAPTSPTLPQRNNHSPASREFRDVLHKISQLPGACTPPSPSGLSSDGGSPGGMLSPVNLTPGMSPGAQNSGLLGPGPPRCCSRGSQTSWTSSPVSSESPRPTRHYPESRTTMQINVPMCMASGNPMRTVSPDYSHSSHSHRPLVASLSLESRGIGPIRPRSLPLTGLSGSSIASSTSTPNLARGDWPDCDDQDKTRAEIIATLNNSRVIHRTIASRTQNNRVLEGRWWHRQISVDHV